MNDRNRALEILKEAKETLANRLTERVLDQQEEILADAGGDSYMNEIESLYEQIGLKLSHVNAMLSNLPVEAPPTQVESASAQHFADDTFTVATDPSPSADAVVSDTTLALAGPLFLHTPALPAPRVKGTKQPPAIQPAATPVSFQLFAAQIQTGDLKGAGKTLGLLFDLKPRRALACATLFDERLRSDKEFLRKASQLRSELHAGSHHAALVLLVECFGLTSDEAAGVLASLLRRLGA
jgi:hypothetical protein